LALAAILLAASSVAEAQSGQNESDTINNCDRVIRSWVKTQNSPTNVTSTSFVGLAGASQTFTHETGRCVVVRFTAETTCRGTQGIDRCFIAATQNGPAGNVLMRPQTLDLQFDSEAEQPSAHAAEWVGGSLEGGSQAVTTVKISVKVAGAAGTTFTLDDWAMEIQLLA
jgi:hypothetical protein